MGLHKISVAVGSNIAKKPIKAEHERNARGTSQASVRVSGCLPWASPGTELLCWALLSVV